jgi:hypothetical protein
MVKPLTLLLLNCEFPRLGGGASNATYHTALELQKRGHNVRVLTSRKKGGAAYENISDVRVFRVRSHRIGYIHRVFVVPQAILRMPGLSWQS